MDKKTTVTAPAQQEAEIVDMLTRISPLKVMEISANFEQIIASQIFLMLRRGVPAEKLHLIVEEAQLHLDIENSLVTSKASGQ